MPVESYELKEFSKLTVQYNHHVFIKADKHYYSVPFQLTGKKVLVSCSYKSVEIFYNNQRVAIHQRNKTPYDYSTKNEHRPKNHQYITKWSPAKFINWAKSISPDVETVIKNARVFMTHITDITTMAL